MKRAREDTEKIVAEALETHVLQKDSKKKGKRVRFSDVQEEEDGDGGGPSDPAATQLCEEGDLVREDLVAEAHAQRASKRQQNKAMNEGTEWVTDVKKFEEELHTDGMSEGEVFEPFNLDEERETGDFQEDGFYVRNLEAGDHDAWLDSEEAKVCSAVALKHHEAMQEQLAASENAKALSVSEVTELKKVISDLLLPRETVAAGLRRLGGKKAAGKKGGSQSEPIKGDPEGFSKLTEAADALMSNGDGDAYICHKEEFAHAVTTFAPAAQSEDAKEDGNDMFGDSDDEKPAQPSTVPAHTHTSDETGEVAAKEDSTWKSNHNTAPQASEAGGSPPQCEDITPEKDDFSGWPISELKRFLQERGENTEGFVEKDDLVKKAAEIASKGPEGDIAGAPDGFVYDPNSGYFYSSDSGMYYDVATGSSYVISTGKWYDSSWQELV